MSPDQLKNIWLFEKLLSNLQSDSFWEGVLAARGAKFPEPCLVGQLLRGEPLVSSNFTWGDEKPAAINVQEIIAAIHVICDIMGVVCPLVPNS